ncbi:MAG: DUF3800 domain-containing protein [Clostridia bacterium]|nr:DUF3800 domain-containing protein [Clostridia bacterium]
MQEIYIYMDDSGQLTRNNPQQNIFVYGGLYFLSKDESDNFSRQYKSIVNSIKPKYCNDFSNDDKLNEKFCKTHDSTTCSYKCPELKSSKLSSADRRHLLNFIKKYNTSVVVVNNSKLRDYIFENKASIGRFKDYAIKREVKNIIEKLISENKIDPSKQVKIFLNLDQQTTISNGYYDLEHTIKEELQYGIFNYNYGIMYPPILSDVTIKIKYKDSYYSYNIQAADLLVGEIRHKYYHYLLNNDFELYRKRTAFLRNSLYLP